MPTQRQRRVARRLQDEIARVLLHEIEDPRVRFVTITDVEVAPDLKHARVFFSVIGEGADEPAEVLRGLRRARKFVQRRLAEKAELRYTPTLDFRYDPTAERAQRIETILKQIGAAGGLDPREEGSGTGPEGHEPDSEDDDDSAP